MYEVIVIGTSWGGLDAVSRLLEGLPDDVRQPIVVVQHRSVESEDGVLAGLAAGETRTSARYLRGGNAAWQEAGFSLSTDPRMADEPLDYWPKPYERPNNTTAAMNEYLSWDRTGAPQAEY